MENTIKTEIKDKPKPGFKLTKLGWIPKEWELVSIEDVCNKFINGGTPSTKIENYWKGNIPWITGADIINQEIHKVRRFITKDAVQNSSTNIIKKGNLLIVTRTGVGKLTIANFDIAISQDLTGVYCNEEKVNTFFLFYYLDYSIPHLARLNQGTSINGITRSTLIKHLIKLPPLPEQQKIAQILSTWDKAIEKTEQLIQAKTQLKKGMMQQLLTGKKRFKEFIFTNKRHNSKVGLIPKDWKIKKLHEIAKFSNGKAHEKYIVENGNYFVVNSKFISTEGKVVKRSNECLSPLNTGDIAIVMSDIPQGAALAKCYFITVDNKYTLNQRIGCIRPYNADNQFVYFILNRNKFYLKFDDSVSQTNLRKDEVIGCPIPLPSLQEQRKITSILNLVQTEIELLQYELELLKMQKKGLMQKLFTGEVRVKLNIPKI